MPHPEARNVLTVFSSPAEGSVGETLDKLLKRLFDQRPNFLTPLVNQGGNENKDLVKEHAGIDGILIRSSTVGCGLLCFPF